ncbi:hypothetical protein LTR64_004604 [Lithohypha guttulata]|uniref:uncharacterized protein n=1 Tax=Lithohypha guttulata TaxID=1690604 RepID=UPI002DDFBA48|nr:hypothetical protein LTR51_006098 [Lithohypha guttulata]
MKCHALCVIGVLLWTQTSTVDARVHWSELLGSLGNSVRNFISVSRVTSNGQQKSQEQSWSANSLRELQDVHQALNDSLDASTVFEPTYSAYDYFDFVNFPADPDAQAAAMVKTTNSLLGAQILLAESLPILDAESIKPTPDNPSFLRYFHPAQLTTVREVLSVLVAILGGPTPPIAEYRRCLYERYRLEKLEISYGKHPALNIADPCAKWGTDAFSHDSARVMMHELMHWEMATLIAYPFFIEDVLVKHRAGFETAAYGAWLSTILKRSGGESERTPGRAATTLDNADSYVSMMLELYYKVRIRTIDFQWKYSQIVQATYNLPDWTDPPPRVSIDDIRAGRGKDPCGVIT